MRVLAHGCVTYLDTVAAEVQLRECGKFAQAIYSRQHITGEIENPQICQCFHASDDLCSSGEGEGWCMGNKWKCGCVV